jgi:hypothetical protein
VCYEITYNHSSAPEDSDRSQEDAWANLAEENRCWWLAEDVRDEENQSDDIVSCPDQVQVFVHSAN